MKTLQNDFTTPEQSKRLLELGVPDESADCVSSSDGISKHVIPDGMTYTEYKFDGDIPCWSVGRLIEIGCKCWNGDRRVILFPNIGIHNNNIMEYVFRYIESDIQLGCLNFSKLEE